MGKPIVGLIFSFFSLQIGGARWEHQALSHFTDGHHTGTGRRGSGSVRGHVDHHKDYGDI